MVTSLSIAVIKVLIRRECAYLIEGRTKVIVESRKGLVDPILGRVHSCVDASNSALYTSFTEHLGAEWPAGVKQFDDITSLVLTAD